MRLDEQLQRVRIMSLRQRLAALLWLLAAAGGFALSTLWVIASPSGQMSAWALVPLVWTAALLALVAHNLNQYAMRRRYFSQQRPMAGPRPGAELPG
jgi:hypothetical protein